jgi:hypothetical protein
MSTVPTEDEQAQLDKITKARSVHFVLLAVLIGLASITFLFPQGVAPLATVGFGVLICLVCISSIKLQYFRKCPRCKTRIARNQGSCLRCDLAFYGARSSEADTGTKE